MALLVLDRAQLDIRSEGDTLALYEAGTRRGTVPLPLVERCIVHGARTRLDSGVLMRLAEAGVPTMLMSPRQPRRVAIVLGPQHNDAAVRLAQSQRVMDDAWCRVWALALVRAKLARQIRSLRHCMAARPDARKSLFDALAMLEPQQRVLAAMPAAHDPRADDDADTASHAANNAATLPSLEQLRGMEGAAARAYFGGLAGVMPPALGFAGRNRRPPRDAVNAGLSLGYTLLHSQAVQASAQAGLDPLLGFYHRPSFGRESLASDLIEPLRPVVDLWLWGLLRERTLREEHFTLDKGACLLGKTGRQIFYAAWEQMGPAVKRLLRRRCRRLARELRQQGLPWLDPSDAADDEHEPC